MKNKLKIVLVIVLLLIFLVMAAYYGLVFHYRDSFGPNTWINGVYCTGKTVEEVNAELLSKIEAPIIMITDEEGREYELELSEMNYQVDFITVLMDFQKKQNPYLWVDNLMSGKSYEVIPTISYDETALKKAFYTLEPIREERLKLKDYLIAGSAREGYWLYDGLSHRMDVEKAFQTLLTSIEAGEYTMNLAQTDCYYDVELSEEQKQQTALWEKIEAYQECELVYDMGDQLIAFAPEVMAGFLATTNGVPILSEENELVLDQEAVEAFVSELAKEYDTYKVEREFTTTSGTVVTIQGGTYGTQINQSKEVEFLMENLLSDKMHMGLTKEHIPSYKRQGNVRGKNDIGDTYVEVDMTAQKLYCYVEGELKLETDIVTGNMRRGMDTPEGFNYVYAKQKNRILRGPSYASPVKYWMPVNGGIGIHDANWRSEFGGDIYKTDGSHGCINIPPKVMPDIYEMIDVGTPVIMYY